MTLTRESRILIVLGIFGLGAVVVLMAMADRYRTMLDPQTADRAGDPPSGRSATAADRQSGSIAPFSGRPGSAAEAEDRVRRYLAVRQTLAEASQTILGDARSIDAGRRARIAGHRDLALERVGLDLGDYLQLRERYRAWKSGSGEAPQRLSNAFAALDLELERAESAIHPSLEL